MARTKLVLPCNQEKGARLSIVEQIERECIANKHEQNAIGHSGIYAAGVGGWERKTALIYVRKLLPDKLTGKPNSLVALDTMGLRQINERCSLIVNRDGAIALAHWLMTEAKA